MIGLQKYERNDALAATLPPDLLDDERLMWMLDHDLARMTEEESIELSAWIVRTVCCEQRGELNDLAVKPPQILTEEERRLLRIARWLNEE
ncbi:hypothetical protein [Xylophilus ampelinus]|uniref:hypothetical protein n=1 Tax=Xylophilus ampelinus TaxID=54067 RepID=UPI0011B52CD6|nr:hypothetical protein [Xylophilus ampelinus]MCS4511110.1 hypothetical protein [Xylophilus ampelinus]